VAIAMDALQHETDLPT